MNIFKVINGNIIHTKKETVNTGSRNFFKLKFEFDTSWELYTLRFLEFYQNIDGIRYKQHIPSTSIVEIPLEVLDTNLPIFVAVCAESEDREVLANTNFVKIPTNYGANTKKDNISFIDNETSFYQIYTPTKELKYLRIENGKLEYSFDNEHWYKVSSAISGGITEEEVFEIINEEVTPQIAEVSEKLEVVESIAKGASVPLTLENYEQLVTIFNDLPNTTYKKGQSAYIVTVNVPDLWIAYVSENSVPYEYSTDQALIDEIRASGSVQIGYYKFAELETQKVDLTDYVKFTDYATSSKAGIVTALEYHGIKFGAGGDMEIVLANQNEISEKKSYYKPITPKLLDYAVKVGVTTNTETLTEEEQASACDWLGAVAKQNPEFDGGATRGYVYFIDTDGNTIVKKVQIQANNDTVPLRNPNGNFYVGTPILQYECTNKGYVDDLYSTLMSILDARTQSLQSQIDELKG